MRRRAAVRSRGLHAVTIVLCAAALAPAAPPMTESGRRIQFPGVFVGTGLRQLDPEHDEGDPLRYLELRSEFPLGPLAVGLDLELGLEDRSLFRFDIRNRDWDEPSDWLRWIDYIDLGRPGQNYYVSVSRLRDVRLGHGTLLDHYQSAIDFDSPRTGAQAGVELGYVSADVLTNDLVRPDVVGGRVALRPLHKGGSSLERPEFGITAQIVSDLRAPERLRFDGSGRPRLDGERNYRAAREPLTAWGLGVELPSIHLVFDLVPYVEWNRIEDFGDGWHVGADLGLTVPGTELNVLARLEWQRGERGYLPTYFHALYEVDRFRFPRLDSATTRREALAAITMADGYLVEARALLAGFELLASFEYVDTEEDNNLFTLGLKWVGSEEWSARVFYVRRGATQLPEAFSFDDASTLGVHVVWHAERWAALDLGYERSYIMDRVRRQFDPVDVWSAALLFGSSF